MLEISEVAIGNIEYVKQQHMGLQKYGHDILYAARSKVAWTMNFHSFITTSYLLFGSHTLYAYAV